MVEISLIESEMSGYPCRLLLVRRMRSYLKACDAARALSAKTGRDYMVQPTAYDKPRLTMTDTIIRAVKR